MLSEMRFGQNRQHRACGLAAPHLSISRSARSRNAPLVRCACCETTGRRQRGACGHGGTRHIRMCDTDTRMRVSEDTSVRFLIPIWQQLAVWVRDAKGDTWVRTRL
eukprot:1173742-Rhodomonas_salina.2